MTHLASPREFALRHRWLAGRALPDGPRCRGRCAPGCPDCMDAPPPPCRTCLPDEPCDCQTEDTR